MKLRPIAVWRIFTWPAPGSPTSTSSSCRTSGPPVLWKRIALPIVASSDIFWFFARGPAGQLRVTGSHPSAKADGTCSALHAHRLFCGNVSLYPLLPPLIFFGFLPVGRRASFALQGHIHRLKPMEPAPPSTLTACFVETYRFTHCCLLLYF